jgi:protein SCO1/2
MTMGGSALAGGVGAWGTGAVQDQALSPRQLFQRRHLPNVELVTHEGAKVRFYDDLVKGKKVLINFMYARCTGICAPVTANLVQVRSMLHGRVGRDIFMYSISLKPRQDTPMALHHFAHMHGTGPGWLFLTGKPADIETLRRGLGFSYLDPVEDARKDNHLGMLRFGDEPMIRWAACPALANPEHIARSIRWELGEV